MAGNVKEWAWNEDAANRYILGGAWNEPSYLFLDADARPPFDRGAANGFRCVKNSGVLSAALTGPIERAYRDYSKEKPVSDQIFEAYRGLYSYDKGPLDARVESADNSHPYWRKERVTFTAGYGNERVAAYLFLPKNAAAPYQILVYHPGSDAAVLRSSETLGMSLIFFEFAMRSGRAVMFPIYKGTYERHVDGNGPNAERDVTIQAVKDAARSVDYLETRPDIDHARIALRIELGGNRGPRICGIESRQDVCCWPAASRELAPPEIDDINFAPRARMPLLQRTAVTISINRPNTRPIPCFASGALRKRQAAGALWAGHPRRPTRCDTEILDWLDKYLGPVKTAG
jgi:hypothetical protein